MRDLTEIHKFDLAKHGEAMILGSEKPRTVRLEVNTSQPTMFAYQPAALVERPGGKFDVVISNEDEPRFLANVDGRDYLLFKVSGPVAIWQTGDGDCWWWCPENERTSVVIPEAETFAKVIEKRPRDHNLERVMRKFQQANERLHNSMRDEFERRLDAAKAEAKPDDGKPDDKAVAKRKGGGKPAKPVVEDAPPPDDDVGGDDEK